MRTEFQLDRLYAELQEVERMTQAQVMAAYNADSKDEIILLIREDIDLLERHHRGDPFSEHSGYDDDPEDDQEEERTALCLSQGLSRYC